MRTYEIAFIADPELDPESRDALDEKVKGWVEGEGGKVLETTHWDKRRLAYPIKKKHDGLYHFLQVELPPQAGALIEREMGLNEQILRSMITLHQQA